MEYTNEQLWQSAFLYNNAKVFLVKWVHGTYIHTHIHTYISVLKLNYEKIQCL
jgi:hypothetical protein